MYKWSSKGQIMWFPKMSVYIQKENKLIKNKALRWKYRESYLLHENNITLKLKYLIRLIMNATVINFI